MHTHLYLSSKSLLRMQGPISFIKFLVRVSLFTTVHKDESTSSELNDHINNRENDDSDMQTSERVPNGRSPVLADPRVPHNNGPDDVEDDCDNEDGDDDVRDTIVVAGVPVEVTDEAHHDVVVAADHAVD